jgi:hypothetical protein
LQKYQLLQKKSTFADMYTFENIFTFAKRKQILPKRSSVQKYQMFEQY